MFQPSELVLTEHNSVYHLDLQPDEIADYIILVGDRSRVGMISGFFDKIELQRENREFVTHTGFYKNKRISVVATGIGTDNIDIVINELDALANIDFEKRELKPDFRKLNFIRIGTCGSLQADISVGSAVISKMVIGMDNLMHFYAFNQTAREKEAQKLLAEHLYKNKLDFNFYLFESKDIKIKKFPSNFYPGITLTAPGFYGPQGRAVRTPLAYQNMIEILSHFEYKNLKVLNFEMETSAIYGLSGMLGHEAVTVDLVIGNRVTKEFAKDYHPDMGKLVKTILDLL